LKRKPNDKVYYNYEHGFQMAFERFRSMQNMKQSVKNLNNNLERSTICEERSAYALTSMQYQALMNKMLSIDKEMI
jgi:hypothetical protein